MFSENKEELMCRVLLAMYKLLKERLPLSAGAPDGDGRERDGLMTIREAYLELNVSRSTVDSLRKRGLLTSVYQGHHVRLLRSEVVAAKRWYSQHKGKL